MVKWLDNIKETGAAFKEWWRTLTILGAMIAGALVVIALELLVICIKL